MHNLSGIYIKEGDKVNIEGKDLKKILKNGCQNSILQ